MINLTVVIYCAHGASNFQNSKIFLVHTTTIVVIMMMNTMIMHQNQTINHMEVDLERN